MNPQRCHLFLRTAAVFGGLALTGLAQAAVIIGTGAVPTSVSLGATDAVGFTLAESGPGHALVVPYFTAQFGQMSVLHLVNTDLSNGKVVKLRFRGAGNGDTLLDFLVLLSPGDVWTGAVTAGGNGVAQLVTTDKTCTYPSILPTGVSFNTARLNPTWTDAVKANNTREGSIEAIVVADLPSAASYGPATNARSALYTAIKHVAGVAPCTPAVLDTPLLTDTTSEAVAASLGFATPTGGVGGSWYIIDVPGSTTFSGAATAFKAVNAAGKNARGNFVLFPQSSAPVNQPERFSADPLLVSAGLAGRAKDASGNLSNLTTAAVLTAQFSDLPDLSTPYYLPASALNARVTATHLSELLSATELSNQYATEVSISAKTDWVFHMPTKRFSVGRDYSASASNALVYSVVPAAGPQFFHSETVFFSVSGDEVLTRPRGAFSAALSRESENSASGFVFIGNPSSFLDNPLLSGHTGVLSFGDTGRSALSASVGRKNVGFGLFTSGWMTVRIQATDGASTNPGLPILGASFIKLTNPAAQAGVSANYGITWPHSFQR